MDGMDRLIFCSLLIAVGILIRVVPTHVNEVDPSGPALLSIVLAPNMSQVDPSVSREEALDKRAELPYGYDENFVNPVDEDLQCSICQSALRDPVLTRCGHRFCKDCLERHMTRQRSVQNVCTCPVDREELVRDKDIFPDKATGRKILSLVIKCSSAGCEWTGELREKENHLSSCSFKLFSCTNVNCEVKKTRNDLQKHVTTECQWRIVACDHCSQPHPKCLLQEHVDNCKKKPVECLNSCGDIIAREEITSHMDNECPLTVISCPYAHIGCDTKIQRKEVESHLQTTTTLHLDLTFKTLKGTAEKLDSLQKQVQDLTAANSALSSKVDAQNKTILKLTSECSTFVWKINNFSQILRQAKNGTKKEILSEPFFTGKLGYKLRVCVKPDGDQSNRHRYLSVYVRPMKGINDVMLSWPFYQKITFTLIDQNYYPASRRNVVYSLHVTFSNPSNPHAVSASVSDESNGIKRFVSHAHLTTRDYVVDDTLFLNVKIDPPE